MTEDLTIGREGAVATIRLNRPPHNFFTIEMLRGIADALAEADRDDAVRATVLTAEGKSFCAGADFTQSAGGADAARLIYAEAARIFDRAKPLIAAINGPAVGGGLGLALAADFRVVGPRARLQANFAAIGLHPGFALTATLPATVGVQRARDILLSARSIDAAEAVAIGLADRADDDIGAAALAYAQVIATNAPLALASIARAVSRVDGAAARTAMESELAEQARLFGTADFREGVRATAERRAAVFEGR